MSFSPRILVFRFSSFGDVLQSLSLIGKLKQHWPEAEIHFCTRKEFAPLVTSHPDLDRLWVLDREAGVSGLIKLSSELKSIRFTHIYDSHNNLRTRVLSFCLNGFLGWRKLIKGHRFLRRPMYRWKRFLLFQFHKNTFPQPFSGQGALIRPLKKWGIDLELPPVPQLYFAKEVEQKLLDQYQDSIKGSIGLAPSAAYPLKRWPLTHFKALIEELNNERFIVFGGPADNFAQDLEDKYPDRVINLAGQLSLLESSILVNHCKALVSNDTGLMHVAEQSGTPCVALMGPAPFGFPCRKNTKILQKDLKCRPCSKHGQGPCVNSELQKCLVDISPAEVRHSLNELGVLNV